MSDACLARVDGKAWASAKGDYVFELPTRSHGQVQGTLPRGRAAVTSVQLYVTTTPPVRQPDPAASSSRGVIGT